MSPRTWKMVPESTCSRALPGKYIYCNISHALKTIDNSIYILEGDSEPRARESVALYTY